MKKIFFSLLLIFVIIFCAVFFLVKEKQKILPGPYLTINNTKINLAIADTPAEQAQGLSHQKELDKNTGMLFVFLKKQVLSFWMKDMNFPLDIIWINDNKIVKIDKNLPPEGEKPKKIYSSEALIDHVLEVGAGYCDEKNIKVGDEVKYFLN